VAQTPERPYPASYLAISFAEISAQNGHKAAV